MKRRCVSGRCLVIHCISWKVSGERLAMVSFDKVEYSLESTVLVVVVDKLGPV